IHSEVGQHCAGARVNGAIVPLRYKLHNGDTVEIITSPQQQPSKDWLEFVATGRARSRIRAYVRMEERKSAIKLGRELLERVFHKNDTSFSRWLKKTGEVERVMSQLKVQSLDDLFALVGYGRAAAQEVFELA